MTAPAQPQQTPPPADSRAQQLAEAAAVIAAYQASTAVVRAQLEGFIRALWASLGLYRSPQMREFTGQAVPTVQGAMAHMADLTSGYLSAMAEVNGHSGPPAPSRAPTIARVRNGADPAEVYGRPFHLVWRQLAELPRQPGSIDQAIKAGEDRAVQTALTDTQLAKTHTAQQSMEKDRRIVGYRRVLEGAYSCGLCIVAATLRYHKAKLLPIHPACVLGGTLVSVPATHRGDPAEGGPIQAASRRRYDGEGVVLRTASGDLLTVTPNHPVLTANGWVPAGLLREGDEVVRSTGPERVVGRVPHEHEVPTLVEDRFRALSVNGLVAVPLAAEDFHGDVLDSQVGVVPADRLLRNGSQSALVEVGGKLALAGRPELAIPFAGDGGLAKLDFGMGSAAVGLMRGGDLGGTLLGGHPPGASLTSLGAVPDDMSCPFHGTNQGGPADAEVVADLERGRAVEIAGNRVRGNHGTWPKFDAPPLEFSGEGRVLHAERGRSLLDRLSGQVELDRLVFVGRVDLSAHVYNLQTAEGFYSANGIIVSNCDCSPEPIWGTEDTGKTVDIVRRGSDGELVPVGELGDVHASIADRFGSSSAAARLIPGAKDGKGNPLQYRDALIVHDHSEIGPVLAIRGAPFLGPSDLNK